MKDSQFWTWLSQHSQSRPSISLSDMIAGAGGPSRCAVVVVDLLEGFCHTGALASPRVAELVPRTVEFLHRCHQSGIRDFLFPCDAHQSDSPEFGAFPPHCIAGTVESEIVGQLRELPFSELFERVDKRSVSSLIETGLATRLQGDQFQKIFCLGDCTDLCLYHLACGLRFLANSSGLRWDIVVPADLVATYDLPVETALEIGAMPHPGDLLHEVFLYHLELNGITVVSTLG